MSEGLAPPKQFNRFTLFSIGFSAGLIAAFFPRLFTFVSVQTATMEINFFTSDFLIASTVFGAIIGISMMWLYWGEETTSKNLYMAGLALPAVLSGAINMSSATVSGQANIAELDKQYQQLESNLQDLSGISEIPTVEFDSGDGLSYIDTNLFPLLGIKSAHAEESFFKTTADEKFNPGIKFNANAELRQYYIILDKSTDKELIDGRLDAYSSTLLIPELHIKKSKNDYYILQKIPRTKSAGLMEIIRLKRHYGIEAKLVRAKPKS